MNSQLLLLINGWAGKIPLLDAAMIVCAKYLVYIVFTVALGCMIMLVRHRKWTRVMYFLATLVASFILLKIAGMFPLDRRPFMDHTLTQLVAHAPGSSFPSDHTTVTMAIAMGILLFTGFRKIGWLFLAAAVLIGFSRVFVGIHYPLDILGGLLTGASGGLVVFLAKRVLEGRSVSARSAHEEV